MKKDEFKFNLNRRSFLGRAGASTLGVSSLVNVVSQLKLMQAAAANTNGGDVVGDDYRALVCIFLNGGCDMNNVVVPIGTHPQANYYQNTRNQVAIPEADITAAGTTINPLSGINAGDQYGLHPSLVNMAQMFEDGELGWMCNVGTLSYPTTKSNYDSITRPDQLFSHSNQVQEWMSSTPNGPFLSGWGGRVAELLNDTANPNSEVSMLITAAGTNDFMVAPPGGLPQYSVTTSGAVSLAGFGTNYDDALNPDGTYQNNANGRRLKAVERIMNYSNAHLLEDGYNTVLRRARENEGLIGDALGIADGLQTAGTVDFDANFAGANNNVGNELKVVAQLIAGRKCLGNKRQIFFVNHGGFDTHQNINGNLPGLLSAVDSAVGAFNQTMKDLEGADTDFNYTDVLGFNASDFNRTFTPNGAPGDLGAGTDHAWGTHAFFFGGSVLGKRIYGAFPDLTVGNNGTQDTPNNNRGRWIPTTSVDQYAAILSSWLGVDTGNGDLDLILPNLERFADPFDAANNINFIDPLA
ncbi:MAG: DUF1501 domain-containing protein [Verrucomicrobiota bacterium]